MSGIAMLPQKEWKCGAYYLGSIDEGELIIARWDERENVFFFLEAKCGVDRDNRLALALPPDDPRKGLFWSEFAPQLEVPTHQVRSIELSSEEQTAVLKEYGLE